MESKTYTQEEVDKIIQEKSNAAFKAAEEKFSKNIDNLRNEYETKPKLEKKFKELGGKDNAFKDWYKLNKETLKDKEFDEVIKEAKEAQAWAFENEGTNFSSTVNESFEAEDNDKGSLLVI